MYEPSGRAIRIEADTAGLVWKCHFYRTENSEGNKINRLRLTGWIFLLII